MILVIAWKCLWVLENASRWIEMDGEHLGMLGVGLEMVGDAGVLGKS